MSVIRVEVSKDYPNIVEILDDNGITLRYLIHPRTNTMILGYPYIAYDPTNKYLIHFFLPASKTDMPEVLRVESM